MKWSEEAQKLDDEVAAMVRHEKQPERLKGLFATAEDLVQYSNEQYPYPHRRNSVMALAVQSGKAEVLEKILQIYFDKNSTDDAMLMMHFLGGTDSCDRFFDYHYFANDLAPEAKAKAMQFQSEDDEEFEMWDFKIRHDLLPRDERIPKQKEQARIYELIRENVVELLSRNQWEITKPERLFARNSDGSVMEEIFDKEPAADGQATFVMLRAQPFLTEISLCDNRNNLHDEAVKLDADSKENFAQQAFKNFYFPELYYWAREPLNKMQKVLQNQNLRRKNKDLEDFFTISGGSIEIIRDYDASMFGNEHQKGRLFKGVCSFLRQENRSIIRISAPQIMEESEIGLAELMAHEMTHNLDMVHSYTTGQGNERLSDSDAIKFAFMALYMEGENYPEAIQNIPLQLQSDYDAAVHTKELVAKVMENRDFGDCKLLQNTKKLVKRFNQAKVEEDEDVLNRMFWAMEEKMPDCEQMRRTYGKFLLWMRSGEQYQKMAEAQKPQEVLQLQKQKTAFRGEDFCRSYVEHCCGKDQPRFDERMAALLSEMLEENKSISLQEQQLWAQESRGR